MIGIRSGVLLAVAVISVAQQPPGKPSLPTKTIMLAAVSRDKSMLEGGITSTTWTVKGTINVEPLARLTPSGEWNGLPCSYASEDTPDGQKNCRAFAKEYLSKRHDYTVISSDGYGAAVHAAATTLGDCQDYAGSGTYSGGAIQRSAIAASSTESFAESIPPTLLNYKESIGVRKALNAFAPKTVAITTYLRVFSVRLEGQHMFVVQRALSDVAGLQDYKSFFAIGTLQAGHFHAYYWKQDDEERLLGTISLKNGREFLITALNDSESHHFRVYGIRAGCLTLIYEGGGSSC